MINFVVEMTIIAVMRYTKDIKDWSVLSLLLGLSERDLHDINIDEQTSTEKHKAIIIKWLDRGSASWAQLVGALKDDLIQQVDIANNIATHHPRGKVTLILSINSESTEVKGTMHKYMYGVPV